MRNNNNVLFCLILIVTLFLFLSCQNNVYIDKSKGQTTKTDVHVHDFENCNYLIQGSEGHLCICNECGQTGELEIHDLILTHNTTHHWWKCTVCGYEDEKELHNFVDDVCSVCHYSRASSQGGLSIHENKSEPLCAITGTVRTPGTNTFVYTLTSLKTDAASQPTTITWTVYYIDDNSVEQVLATDNSNTYTFSFTAEGTEAYKGRYLTVLCVYSNDFGTSSDSTGMYGYEI